LFDHLNSRPAKAVLPTGFRYQAEFISESEEKELTAVLGTLTLKPFEFHGHVGNRRVVSFGLRYDYSKRAVKSAADAPAFLDNLRVQVAQFAGYDIQDFKQIGINEYRVGAGIGWHRDKQEFGDIVGVSLLSRATIRFRKRSGEGWTRQSHILEPRSIYLLSGEARQLWEHSIPPVLSLRFSVTFRTLAAGGNGGRLQVMNN
jgi:alkylated DNA repair dioxygenase AlkB